MVKIKKQNDGVFINIVGNHKEHSSYIKFINKSKDVNSSKELVELIKTYTRLITTHKTTFEILSIIEEIIIQMKIRENLPEMKLSKVREYVYARVPFYRKNIKSKDVRVLVDKIEFYPHVNGNVNLLLDDKKFMDKAIIKITKTMDNEITENIRMLKLNYGM